MIDLLMLGIVPGTNIQISFSDWLVGLGSIVTVVAAISFLRHRLLMVAVILAILRSERRRFKSLRDWAQSHAA
jgi:hypothetical protein